LATEEKKESIWSDTADSTLLESLLQRPSPAVDMPERVDGIMLGRVTAAGQKGHPIMVVIAAFGPEPVAAADSLVPLTSEHVGRIVALGFKEGDPRRPVVLGLIFDPTHKAPAVRENEDFSVRRENGRVVVEAEKELELRCGKAVVLLRADGRIDIRGGYINSHASAGQRIRGGSVQIN